MTQQDEHYRRLAAEYGDAVARLARATEADGARREELVQEIHLQLWRSLASFDGRCSERTWVFRVAHNVAASHVDRHRRRRRPTTPLHEVEPPDPEALSDTLERRQAVAVVAALARELSDIDRQVLLLHLEGLRAAEVGEIVGISANAVSIRLHRLRGHLARRLAGGREHG